MKSLVIAIGVCATLNTCVYASPCYIISDDKFVCLGLKDRLKGQDENGHVGDEMVLINEFKEFKNKHNK